MTTVWMLNMIGLLATTVGVLIVFLHLHRTTRAPSGGTYPVECMPLQKDRRLLMITVGLMALWFIIQYVAFLFTT